MRVETNLLSLETEQYAGKGQHAAGIAAIAESARNLEALGFDGVTTPEAGHDPFLPLVIAAEHSRRIALATNVAIAFPRSPLTVAQIAWDLQRLSNGRFQLGLGTQVKGHNERRYSTAWSAAPGPRLREYILCLKAIFRTFQEKKPTYFEGKHYQFTLMSPFFNPGPIEQAPPAIHIAAVNKYMARLGGELCDGLRLHPIATFAYTRAVLLPEVEAGARKAGRARKSVDVIGAPFLAIGRDREEIEKAKNALRQRVAFYASTRTYHAVLEFHGWTDLGLELHERSLQGRWAEMAQLITDEVLEELAIIGTLDDLGAKVKERCGDLFDSVLLDLPASCRNDEAAIGRVLEQLH